MKDCLGRDINYLRVSLTPNCNLCCLYCMPEKGCILNKKTLSSNDFLRLITLICKTDIKKIRLTGGEPLLFPDLIKMIDCIKKVNNINEIAITTNGILLEKFAEPLKKAGVNSINLSLDAVEANLFKKITRGGDINKVFSGIKKAKEVGINIKLNSVIIKNINEEQIFPLIYFAQKENIILRFIELMPLDVAARYKGIKEDEIKTNIVKKYGSMKLIQNKNKSAAHYYCIEKLKSPIGFISALSHIFCNSCNRLRLTSNGVLKPCLHHRQGIDLRALLRQNKTDVEILECIKTAIYNKPARHHLNNENFSQRENRSMSLIGG